jgi:hypothetical protein
LFAGAGAVAINARLTRTVVITHGHGFFVVAVAGQHAPRAGIGKVALVACQPGPIPEHLAAIAHAGGAVATAVATVLWALGGGGCGVDCKQQQQRADVLV